MTTPDEDERPTTDWTWHMILTRPHVLFDCARCPVASEIIPLDLSESCKDTAMGWQIRLFRIESGLFDEKTADEDRAGNDTKDTMVSTDTASNNNIVKLKHDENGEDGEKATGGKKKEEMKPKCGETEPFIPLELAERLQAKYPDVEGLYDFDNPKFLLDSMQDLIRSPWNCLRILRCSDRCLLDITEEVNTKYYPKAFVKTAMQILSTAQFKGVKRMSDQGEFNEAIHTMIKETDWIAAVKERPRSICLHIPLPRKVIPQQEIDEMTKDIHLAFPHAKVTTNTDVKDDSANGINRLMWVLELSSQLNFRYNLRGGKEEKGNPADLNLGIDDFDTIGKPMKNVPEKPANPGFSRDTLAEYDNYRHHEYFKYTRAFGAASHLLALRPWSHFAPFEVLKVTIKEDGEETVRWIQFVPNDPQGEGSSKSNGPFGSMQIQKDLHDITASFGYENMNLRSGMYGSREYPDRLFVAADSITQIHYETTYLLKKLFGDNMGPLPYSEGEPVLEYGVVPNMEVRTGHIEGYATVDSLGRPPGRRPLTSGELDIVSRVCSYLRQFVKDHKKLGMKPSDGVFERTYHMDYYLTGESRDSVTVTYNMDQKLGGLWDTERKWMWFD